MVLAANTNSPSQAKIADVPTGPVPVLVVGVGSPYGDDQLGWMVVQHLMQSPLANCHVRIAATPIELLDWIEGYDVLHLVDACLGIGIAGTAHRWSWPCEELGVEGWSGTHDFSIPAVLALAEQLELLPQRVVLWGIERGGKQTNSSLSHGAAAWIESMANRIRIEVESQGLSVAHRSTTETPGV